MAFTTLLLDEVRGFAPDVAAASEAIEEHVRSLKKLAWHFLNQGGSQPRVSPLLTRTIAHLGDFEEGLHVDDATRVRLLCGGLALWAGPGSVHCAAFPDFDVFLANITQEDASRLQSELSLDPEDYREEFGPYDEDAIADETNPGAGMYFTEGALTSWTDVALHRWDAMKRVSPVPGGYRAKLRAARNAARDAFAGVEQDLFEFGAWGMVGTDARDVNPLRALVRPMLRFLRLLFHESVFRPDKEPQALIWGMGELLGDDAERWPTRVLCAFLAECKSSLNVRTPDFDPPTMLREVRTRFSSKPRLGGAPDREVRGDEDDDPDIYPNDESNDESNDDWGDEEGEDEGGADSADSADSVKHSREADLFGWMDDMIATGSERGPGEVAEVGAEVVKGVDYSSAPEGDGRERSDWLSAAQGAKRQVAMDPATPISEVLMRAQDVSGEYVDHTASVLGEALATGTGARTARTAKGDIFADVRKQRTNPASAMDKVRYAQTVNRNPQDMRVWVSQHPETVSAALEEYERVEAGVMQAVAISQVACELTSRGLPLKSAASMLLAKDIEVANLMDSAREIAHMSGEWKRAQIMSGAFAGLSYVDQLKAMLPKRHLFTAIRYRAASTARYLARKANLLVDDAWERDILYREAEHRALLTQFRKMLQDMASEEEGSPASIQSLRAMGAQRVAEHLRTGTVLKANMDANPRDRVRRQERWRRGGSPFAGWEQSALANAAAMLALTAMCATLGSLV